MPSSLYRTLSEFIQTQMRMQHVYQPVMIQTLLENNGEATVRQIASAFLAKDQSQLEYYEEITRRMPGKVLSNRGIVEKIGNAYRLSGEVTELTEDEKGSIIRLCQEKLEEYMLRRGSDGFDHRRAATGYVSGSMRYEVLKRAGFRCELCGISASKRALEIDHIHPRSLGGQDTLENFQALCYICNANKGNRDNTSFREESRKLNFRSPHCTLCSGTHAHDAIIDNSMAFAVWCSNTEAGQARTARDAPNTTRSIREESAKFDTGKSLSLLDNHALVAPKRHVSSYFELFDPERRAIHLLLEELRTRMLQRDRTISSFSIRTETNPETNPDISHTTTRIQPVWSSKSP